MLMLLDFNIYVLPNGNLLYSIITLYYQNYSFFSYLRIAKRADIPFINPLSQTLIVKHVLRLLNLIRATQLSICIWVNYHWLNTALRLWIWFITIITRQYHNFVIHFELLKAYHTFFRLSIHLYHFKLSVI